MIFLYVCGGAFITSQDGAQTAFDYSPHHFWSSDNSEMKLRDVLMQSVPVYVLCMTFVIEYYGFMEGIPVSLSRLEATQQTFVCNSTLQFEANRHIHATSTHWSQQMQYAEWREGVSTCQVTYETGLSQSEVWHTLSIMKA
jgi:hypothetical protein